MKIGILTFHRSENYGSVLQAYALSRALKAVDESCEVEFIDYSNAHQRELYSIYLKNNSVKNVVKNVRAFLNISQLKRKKAGFTEFINALPLSAESYDGDEALKAHKSKYDLVICGSDQIWNPQSLDFSLSFFGVDFDCKKAAYAPSIRNASTSDFEPFRDKIKAALADFSKVSLREKNSIPVLQELCEKEIDCVCDPTLLLSAEDYEPVCSPEKPDGDYIFYYSIDYNAQSVEMVKHISKTLGLPVYFLFSSNKAYNVYFKGFKLSANNAPGDFISLVKNAKLVLSNSFHGTAFAVIYRKPFWALRTRGYTDARINDLLSGINLSSRYIDYGDYKALDYTAPVNYDEAAVQKLRDYSLNYLKDCLNA